jgi:hypothetical protein
LKGVSSRIINIFLKEGLEKIEEVGKIGDENQEYLNIKGFEKMIIPKECDDCLYIKLRNEDPETRQLARESFCLQSGVLIKCEEAVSKCIVQRLKKTVVKRNIYSSDNSISNYNDDLTRLSYVLKQK